MKTTPFTPLRDLIVVKAEVWGPLGPKRLKLALDTASSHTVILPGIMDELGVNPRDGLVITGVYSAVGKEQGYLIKVPRFSALGFTLTDFPIHVFDLASHYGIHGSSGSASCTGTTTRCAPPRARSSSRRPGRRSRSRARGTLELVRARRSPWR